MYYIHKDYLSSYESITDSLGNIVEKLNYDPWGRRRNPSSWYPIEEAAETETDRGFTGHEHLDLFALVNMNGRIYDPVVGYFTSPDPVVGIPTGTQSFNLYSYVHNNPLKYTDPSGYKPEEIADIGAGPMWYDLYGSDMIPNWLDFDAEDFYSGDFAGGFDEAIGGCCGDKKKKSSSAKRPEPLNNKTRRYFDWNSLGDANGSSGLGPVDPYRNMEFNNEKILNDLSDFDDGTQPSRRVNPSGGSTGGGDAPKLSLVSAFNTLAGYSIYTSASSFAIKLEAGTLRILSKIPSAATMPIKAMKSLPYIGLLSGVAIDYTQLRTDPNFTMDNFQTGIGIGVISLVNPLAGGTLFFMESTGGIQSYTSSYNKLCDEHRKATGEYLVFPKLP